MCFRGGGGGRFVVALGLPSSLKNGWRRPAANPGLAKTAAEGKGSENSRICDEQKFGHVFVEFRGN
jgi:hypothetical protein